MSARPTAEPLRTDDALLSRTRPRELGLEWRAVGPVFRALPVVLPGLLGPLVRASDDLALLDASVHDGTTSVR